MSGELLQTLRSMLPDDNILEKEDMSKHTTFRVGGPASIMLLIDNAEQLAQIIKYLNAITQEYFILGNGSNLLVSDKGYDGVVLKLSGDMSSIQIDGNKVRCGAAALLSGVAKSAGQAGLTGMEFASGIPGSIGGAMVMNAGAYGGEISQITESVTVVNEFGEFMTLDADTMEFDYRSSVIKGTKYVVTEVVLNLKPGDASTIETAMRELSIKRREKQPLEYPSAGSTFKRPEGYYAGKLIMDAGLRGFSIGGARVSDKHCGFVINEGHASAADIYDVITQVQEVVKKKFDVSLEREVILVGDF